MLFRFQVLFCKYMQRLNIYSICVVFLDLKQNKSLCVLFLYVVFSFLLNVYSFTTHFIQATWFKEFQFFLNLKHKHIFKIYKVPVRCQTEIGVSARPFCNFCEVSNIKVRFDFINNTKRGKTTLGDSFTQLHGTRPFTRVHKSEEKWQFSPLQCENICLLLQASIIILLLQILSSYSYCGTLVPSRQRNSLLDKADHMSSVTTTILRKASNGIPKFFGKCLFSS